METIKAYLAEKVVHSEIVLEVALIAIARKVITLNVKDYQPMALIGIAALIISISLAYFLIQPGLDLLQDGTGMRLAQGLAGFGVFLSGGPLDLIEFTDQGHHLVSRCGVLTPMGRIHKLPSHVRLIWISR